jgi:hypothetical protein
MERVNGIGLVPDHEPAPGAECEPQRGPERIGDERLRVEHHAAQGGVGRDGEGEAGEARGGVQDHAPARFVAGQGVLESREGAANGNVIRLMRGR